jgi:tetratricopeptide (TPR) repeat protein
MRLAILLWLLASGTSDAADQSDAFSRVSKQASEAREQNRIPDALNLYRQAVTIRPAWTEGWWYLGMLLYDQDQYAPARDALRRLVSLDPKAGPAFAFLGLCEYQTREHQQALADINLARRLGLGNDLQTRRVVLYHALLLYTRFAQYESALQVLEKVVKTGDITPALIVAAGLAGLRRPIAPEDLPAADKDLVDRAGKAACAVAARNPTEASQYFADLLDHYPNAPNVHYLYASFLAASDADAALLEFQKELALNPKNSEVLATIALQYEQRGDPDKAIPFAQRAVDADPDFFAAHGVLGRLLANSGEVEKGVKELEIARREAPDSPQVHFSLAAAYVLAGRKEDAARERAEFVRLKQLADDTLGK